MTGFATSITHTADGWATPAEVARLRVPGAPPSAQMLYRFASAAREAQIRADGAEVTRALPPGAVASAGSWLTAESKAAGNAAIVEPFVVAFALIGLAMAVLIVANVVSGAVVAGYHRIGVLKSIGLTPAQVVVCLLYTSHEGEQDARQPHPEGGDRSHRYYRSGQQVVAELAPGGLRASRRDDPRPAQPARYHRLRHYDHSGCRPQPVALNRRE